MSRADMTDRALMAAIIYAINRTAGDTMTAEDAVNMAAVIQDLTIGENDRKHAEAK